MKALVLTLLSFAFFPHYKSLAAPIYFETVRTTNMEKTRAGRFLYFGAAPRFAANDFELYVGKIILTMRAKAWVKKEMPDNYSWFLIQKWKRIHDAFFNPKMRFSPFRSTKLELANAKDAELIEWLKIVEAYHSNPLENLGFNIYDDSIDTEQYKSSILTSLLRFYFNDSLLTIEKGEEIYTALRNPETRANDAQKSRELWKHHLGTSFTKDSSRGDTYEGFLTFVYPYAGSLGGPYWQPKEGVYSLAMPGSSDARWWSGQWKDEFGNLPFLMYRSTGGAIHGPTVSKEGVNAWYLDRDWISHGCLRMNPSDLLEIRAMMPTDVIKNPIKQYVMEGPDVMDFQGERVVVNPDYYRVPDKVPVSKEDGSFQTHDFLIEQQRKTFLATLYNRFNSKLPNGNSYNVESNSFTGIPKYSVLQGKLIRDGVWNESIPVKTFQSRGTQVIQYIESGATPAGITDQAGDYPPSYFLSP